LETERLEPKHNARIKKLLDRIKEENKAFEQKERLQRGDNARKSL